jgi:hypothetical protein
LAESNNSGALSKIRAYLHKWRPIRSALPGVANELETLGYPRGPKFDAIVEQVFAMQLTGRGKTPEERIKILRKLSGIKEAPKKKEKEKKPAKGAEKHAAAGAIAGKKHESRDAHLAAKLARKTETPAAKHPARHTSSRRHGRASSAGKKSKRRK